ncbi:MAG: carotenoid biosynthesis protein [Verrucomicrobia subdivision 3 bacterium]|nr:carotenoid biosynthesis protein [Limisphaerales bacterium]
MRPANGAVTRWAAPWQAPLLIAFLLCWAVNVALAASGVELATTGLAEAMLLLLALATTLAALARRIPLQNVVVTAFLIAVISSALLSLAAVWGVPGAYSDALGERIFGVLPWTLPLIWIVVLINARAMARLILRPWRQSNSYGWWVMGLAGLLCTVFDLALEPLDFGFRMLAWFLTGLAILVFCTPWLINKRPVKIPTDYQPLVVWASIHVWLAIGNARRGLWLAVWIGLLLNAVVIVLAICGALWKQTANDRPAHSEYL